MKLLRSLLSLLSAAALAAQVPLGGKAPALQVEPWLCGTPVVPGTEGCKFLLVGLPRQREELAPLVDQLREVVQRHADAGLRAIALLPARPDEPVAEPLPVGVQGDDYHALVAGATGSVALLAADGTLLWRGRPAHGLFLAVQRALADELDAAKDGQAAEQRDYLRASLDDGLTADVLAIADAIVARWPVDGEACGLRYLVLLERAADADAARAFAAATVTALEGEPAALVAFADLALRGNPADRALATRLAAALAQVEPRLPRDLAVRFVRLRALVRAARTKDALRLAAQLQRSVIDDGANLGLLAETLADGPEPQALVGPAVQAIDRARELNGDSTFLRYVRHKVLVRCQGDAKAADELVAATLPEIGSGTALNNAAWYLMTDPDSRGRFDTFATALVDRMLTNRAELDAFELDTAALGLFLAGRVEAAVETATTALEKAGGNEEYAQRLLRYRAFLPAKPR